MLGSASGVLGCEEAATEQTNRVCEDRKQLRTTRPRLLRNWGGRQRPSQASHSGQLGVDWGKASEGHGRLTKKL